MKIQTFFKSKKRRYSLAIIVVLILTIGLTWAASTHRLKIFASGFGTYSQGISGHVYDRDGKPIYQARISNPKTGEYALSGTDGSFSLGLPVGSSSVVFEKDGTITNPNFTDIPFDPNNLNDPTKTFWAAKYISALKSAGVVSGYPDGTFHPSEQVTRAQMAVFLARALAGGDANVPAASGQTFTDVPSSYWAYKYIEYLVKYGGLTGYPDHTFKPEDKVTRAMMAVFLCKALSLDDYSKSIPTFSDVQSTYWAYNQIERLVLNGIAGGYSDGTYKPETIVTRDQMTKFIALAFPSIKLTNGGYIPQIKQVNLIAGSTANATLDIYLGACGVTNTVTGQAKKTDGSVVAGAKVTLSRKPGIDEEYTTTTGTDGKFKFVNIPNGDFSYSIVKPEARLIYKSSQFENMIPLEGGSHVLNIFNLTESSI